MAILERTNPNRALTQVLDRSTHVVTSEHVKDPLYSWTSSVLLPMELVENIYGAGYDQRSFSHQIHSRPASSVLSVRFEDGQWVPDCIDFSRPFSFQRKNPLTWSAVIPAVQLLTIPQQVTDYYDEIFDQWHADEQERLKMVAQIASQGSGEVVFIRMMQDKSTERSIVNAVMTHPLVLSPEDSLSLLKGVFELYAIKINTL